LERLWGTAQDRLVKELRLARSTTMEQANAVLEARFLPWFNRRCVVKPSSVNDAHRALGREHDLGSILSHQEQRVVGNDYTIRLNNQWYQLLPPAWPGERGGGKVIAELRLDGSLKIRFKERYLDYRKIDPLPTKQAAKQGAKEAAKEADGVCEMGAPPPNPRSLSHQPIPAAAPACKAKGPALKTGPSAEHRTAGRSGRTPAEPCPSGGGSCGSGKSAWRPASSHPWR